ncbi:MAG: succinate dehydrogenase, cytochrome b556 subunit [Rhodobacteraceae bacterium]|nr:succinate dehydrogenase, cytochrome b556 subunit [Paracoccaceae bacterium]MBC66645.1 succinate dehydrogenase, cytochrome b556 subunit [Paracoccaceae bacterium]RZO37352.1 MAG: succinate dehydrogenase, cytochrome b556 subunit [Paracoccaceae bacterium]|tara:strand:- start:7003 stop:7398 length:396 start_codon:yes stop_codon:yes gene_type:complete
MRESLEESRNNNRPLSPHLDIYQYQITWTVSIMHRITGVAMTLGLILIVAWLVAAAFSPELFSLIDGVLRSWIGMIIIFGSLWAFWFHFLNGIRHLFWDLGYGFNLSTVWRSGWVVVLGSIILTIFSFLIL